MAYRLCEATLNGWMPQDEYQEQIAELMKSGKELLQIELDREEQDTEQAKSKASIEKERQESFRKTLDVMTNPALSDELRHQLQGTSSKLFAPEPVDP